MCDNDFWSLFQEYLPLLAGLIALTSAAIFSYLLQKANTIKDATASKALHDTLQLRLLLKSNGMLSKEDRTNFNDIVDSLKRKSISENIEIANRPDDYTNKEIDKEFDRTILLACSFLMINIALYTSFILSILNNAWWIAIIVCLLTIGSIKLWYKIKPKP